MSRADVTCQELASWVDHLYDSRNASQGKVLAALPLPPTPDVGGDQNVQQLTDTVAALQFCQPKARAVACGRGSSAGNKNRGGQQLASRPMDTKLPPGLCFTHYKYGSDTYSCKDPQNYMLSLGN